METNKKIKAADLKKGSTFYYADRLQVVTSIRNGIIRFMRADDPTDCCKELYDFQFDADYYGFIN